MNRDCEIVKDLFPSYLGNILSNETENFVNEHISDCSQCQEILQNMKKDKTNNEMDQNDQIEVDHLKKYRNRMRLLKILLISIVVLIVLLISIFAIRYNYNTNIMNKVSNSINTLKNSDNYIIKTIEHSIDYERNTDNTFIDLYYYKDGKYKKESHFESQNTGIVNPNNYYYGEINSNKQIEVTDDLHKVFNKTSNYDYVKKGEFFNALYSDVGIFGKDLGLVSNIISKNGYQLRMDRYNGKECYIFKLQDKSGYIEYWVEKENMIPVRMIQDEYYRNYTEKTYWVSLGNVTENDVAVPNLEGYKVENIDNTVNNEALEIYNHIRK